MTTTPAATAADDDVIFHGIPVGGRRPDNAAAAGEAVIFVQKPDGSVLGTVVHHPKHSPSGLSWGYEGSGPADCARTLLIAALGSLARCDECRSTRKVVVGPGEADTEPYRPHVHGHLEQDPDNEDRMHNTRYVTACHGCDEGFHLLPYQEFKREYVAAWPTDGEWRMSRPDILAWLSPRTDVDRIVRGLLNGTSKEK